MEYRKIEWEDYGIYVYVVSALQGKSKIRCK